MKKEKTMPDDFRQYGLWDVARASNLTAKIVAWVRDLRHSSTESIDNEDARTRELSEEILRFNNERLAPSAGTFWVPDPTPFDLEHVEIRDASFVHNAIKAAIPKFEDGVSRWPLDSKFRMVNQDEMAKIIGWSWVDQKQYVSDYFDCEDFAFCFKSEVSRMFMLNQVGLVIDWSGGHGYNLIVFPDGEVWFYEPMDDSIVSIGTGIYKMERAFILI